MRATADPPADPPAGPADPLAVGRRIAAASDERRRQVERVLHDGVQQHLALLGLKLSLLQDRIRSDPVGAEELCEQLRQEIRNALAELRSVALLIYPALLDNEGLAAALQRSAGRYPVRVDVAVHEQVATPPDLVAPLYFCLIETIELVAQHASTAMSVTVLGDADAVRFELHAPHTDASAEVLRLGMGYLRDRMTALGGTVGLDASGAGVTVSGVVPLDPPVATP